MDKNKEAVLARIVKLFALAEDQVNTPEGKAAFTKAARLMAQYSISELDLKFAKADSSSDDVAHDEDGLEGLIADDRGQPIIWAMQLAGSVALTFHCKVYTYISKNTIHFIGTDSDIETALYFMVVLHNFIEQKSWELFPNSKHKRLDFGMGAFHTISKRLQQMRIDMDRAVAEHYQGTKDLMILKDSVVKQAYDIVSDRLNLKKIENKSKRKLDQVAFGKGMEEGKKAPMSIGINN